MHHFKKFCDASQSPLWMIQTMIFPHPLSPGEGMAD